MLGLCGADFVFLTDRFYEVVDGEIAKSLGRLIEEGGSLIQSDELGEVDVLLPLCYQYFLTAYVLKTEAGL